MKRIRHAGLLACIGTLGLVLAPSLSDAAILSGVGTGDITFHSSLFADISSGTLPIPQSTGALTYDAMAPGGVEHGYMEMSWDFDNYSSWLTDVFVRPAAYPFTTKLEVIP